MLLNIKNCAAKYNAKDAWAFSTSLRCYWAKRQIHSKSFRGMASISYRFHYVLYISTKCNTSLWNDRIPSKSNICYRLIYNSLNHRFRGCYFPRPYGGVFQERMSKSFLFILQPHSKEAQALVCGPFTNNNHSASIASSFEDFFGSKLEHIWILACKHFTISLLSQQISFHNTLHKQAPIQVIGWERCISELCDRPPLPQTTTPPFPFGTYYLNLSITSLRKVS